MQIELTWVALRVMIYVNFFLDSVVVQQNIGINWGQNFMLILFINTKIVRCYIIGTGFVSNRKLNARISLRLVLYLSIVPHLYFIGSWPEETLEATERTKGMDVGQAWWCLCTTTKYRAPQTKGVPSSCNFPSQQTQVCPYQL